jgi:hypothetical protein
MSNRKPPPRQQPPKRHSWSTAGAWLVMLMCFAVWLVTIAEAWK